FRVEQLAVDTRLRFFDAAAGERAAGGRIYDAHIAEIARQSGAGIVVTDNRSYFTALMKYGIRVVRPAELLNEL
ncbi:MAG: hypothetical protein JXA73_16425, partial [Acidobacteria bacterium]|nr:hypothetical protein [Acidobacteriota bacterium]